MKHSRRTFLRGLGTSIALPAMASLAPSTASAATGGTAPAGLATTASGAPLRCAFLFFPNGAIPKAWWPQSSTAVPNGTDYTLSPTLEPLAAVRDHVQVIKGLDNVVAEAGPDGGGDHARGNGTFLTNVRIQKSATAIKAGISIDQVIANRVGDLTRFPSLELASDPRRQSVGCDSGYSCAYQFNISWKSATTPMATEHNPRMAFERIFGQGPAGQRVANLQRRREEQRSILDYVLEDARSMKKRLASEDVRKLDEFLGGVRALESQIQRAERLGDPRDPEIETPAGVPADHQDYVTVMFELMALAFQTDSTRVATLMLGHDGDNRSFDFLGISEGHHDLTHHQNDEDRIAKVQQIDRWYAARFADFIKRLDSIVDVDGQSVLHNSMVMIGSGNADGNRHTHADLPILLAGSAGGQLRPGRFVDHQHVPLANLYLRMTQAMGIDDVSEFGNSTGVLADV